MADTVEVVEQPAFVSIDEENVTVTVDVGITRLQDASDLTGSPGTGKGWVRDGSGAMVWTDLATQAELDAHAALTATAHGNLLMPRVKTGNYVSPLGVISSAVFIVNTLYYVPVWLTARAFDRASFNVTVLGASGTARLGIYADSDGNPGALIAAFGVIDTSSTGVKEITIAHTPAAFNLYWLALVCQTAGCSGHGVATGSYLTGRVGVTDVGGGFYETGVSGALPANAGTLLSNAGTFPRVSLRAA